MSNQIRVLYVSDDPKSLRTWSEFLADQRELSVSTAKSIPDGVETAANDDVDCVLSDLTTDDRRNLEFLDALKERRPTLPFFLFTEDEADRTINEAIKAGAADYISKSVAKNTEGALVTRIQQSLNGHAETQEPPNSSVEQAANGDGTATSIDIVEPGEMGVGDSSSRKEKPSDESDAPGSRVDADTASPPPSEQPRGFDPDSGTSTLVQCRPELKRTRAACPALISSDDLSRAANPADPSNEQSTPIGGRNDSSTGRFDTTAEPVDPINVTLIRYEHLAESALARIADRAERTTIISIGYRQSIPNEFESEIEDIHINSPTDLTRLGIVLTGAVEDLETHPPETVVCFDSLSALLQYKSVKQVFKFLHILLTKLQSAEATSCFYIDHTVEERADILSLKPVFDTVVTVTDQSVEVETAH